MARHIANLNVRDVVVIRRHHAADHCVAVQATLQCTFANSRQRNQIIARVSRNRLNDNVMATLPQVDAVLVQYRHRLVANDFFRGRFEIQMGQQAVLAMLERHRPAMRIDDGDALHGKSINTRHEHTDVPPVAILRLAFLSRIRAVSADTKLLSAIACRPRIVRSHEHGVADADNMDVADLTNILYAVATVRRPDEIVAATIRQLDHAVFDDECRIRIQQNRFVNQPEIATVRIFTTWNAQRAAALLFQHGQSLRDAFRIRSFEFIRCNAHCLTPYQH